MRNIRLIISYDGTNFHGFQTQPKLRTVQGQLQEAIEQLTGEYVQVIGSGRTDAGVHAEGQVANFHTSSKIPVDKWPHALNAVLPDDLVVRAAREVSPTFHARFDAKGKIYRYQIDRSVFPDVFVRRYAWHVSYPLDVGKMAQAASHMVGCHDFTSFCNAATPLEDRRRHVTDIRISEAGHLLHVTVSGKGFLWNMVRIMAGTLVDVGKGRIMPDEIPTIIHAQDRTYAGVTAPAHGLTLVQVEYED
ncbi:tRNA pseudouridine(38-40) synthase TruA [Effusibacillus dendaii]|uniref:tRNA pseudouridine synthase A n=1 Tax=Effusibacillus dendaii TaxID=2743772 RepID=A0A7I8DEC6_9BACL|nr:tRNA pseudouridine(38-40) synthase TruA [Effusibacillus dendaii]BCJ87309.1 tRNA pseudouridine synthase A [Effusibacillus dendaii]